MELTTGRLAVRFALLATLSLQACDGPDDKPNSPGPRPAQALIAKGDCSFEACSSLPSTFQGTAKVECSRAAADACHWSPVDPNEQAVSYAHCDDAECPARPAINCPGDTVKSSQQCGNENNAGCAWTTICQPPRQTTPCPQPTGCNGQPVTERAVFCSDGSLAGVACVTDGARCYWERDCD